MRIFLIPVVLALLLSGCNSNNQTPTKLTAPGIDVSTPDKTVKSLWAVIDWRSAMGVEEGQRYIKTSDSLTWLKLQEQLNAKEITASITANMAIEKYSRDIVQANVETESRAVVVAIIKNITPLPADAVLSKYQIKARDEGSRIKYVLEKNASNWQISEAWVWDEYSNGFRKSRPDNSTYYPVSVHNAW